MLLGTNMNHKWIDVPADHPAIMAIALDLILHPEYRIQHSVVVLRLADQAIEKIKASLQDSVHD